MKATKTNRKAKMVICTELVGSLVEEWTVFRVYKGGKRVASFMNEDEAKAFVKAA